MPNVITASDIPPLTVRSYHADRLEASRRAHVSAYGVDFSDKFGTSTNPIRAKLDLTLSGCLWLCLHQDFRNATGRHANTDLYRQQCARWDGRTLAVYNLWIYRRRSPQETS